MTGNEQRQLHRQLWKVADELRGRMDADDFRDYILGFVFFKYLSERVESHADKLLQPEHIGPYDSLDPTTHHDYIQAIRLAANIDSPAPHRASTPPAQRSGRRTISDQKYQN